MGFLGVYLEMEGVLAGADALVETDVFKAVEREPPATGTKAKEDIGARAVRWDAVTGSTA